MVTSNTIWSQLAPSIHICYHLVTTRYTRYGFRQLLEGKCCDVIQPDITWCGGVTEARRIWEAIQWTFF